MSINLNPFTTLTNALDNSISYIFNGIWSFLLFNVISPFLIISFVVLFFIGQYYLLKLYINVSKTIFEKLYKVFTTFKGSEKYNEVLKFYSDALK